MACAAVTGVVGFVGCAQVNAKAATDAALANLQAATAATFTIRLDDPNDNLVSHAREADRRSTAALADSTVTVTVTAPAGSTLGQAAGPASAGTDPSRTVGVSFAYAYRGTTLVQLRLVAGVLYAKLDLPGLAAMTGTPGSKPWRKGVDSDPIFGAALGSVLTKLEAGKWLSLDLDTYQQVTDALSKSGLPGQPTPSQPDPAQISGWLQTVAEGVSANLTSIPRVDGATTYVDVKVNARAAAAAIVDRLAGANVPGLDAAAVPSAKADVAKIADGTVDGTLTITDGHLTRIAVDLHSLALLGDDRDAVAATDGVRLLVDVDDSAAAVSAPARGEVAPIDSIVTGIARSWQAALRDLPRSVTSLEPPRAALRS
ncbi:MAG: hypothetical protein EPO13_07500 [Actinomycetota bacterium]|nr:MAG: hypothetical protein EPO13_07500 [Actinomycetota bacterium]